MSERPSCAAGGVGDDDGRPRGRRIEDLPCWNRGGRCAVGTFSMLAVLAVGSAATSRALAQDAAPKAEAQTRRVRAARNPKGFDAGTRDELTESPIVSSEAPERDVIGSARSTAPTEDPAKPEVITQYRVGVVETRKEVWEKAQGAPEKQQLSQQTIYTERAAKVGRDGEVTDTVRRYDKVRIQQAAPVPPRIRRSCRTWKSGTTDGRASGLRS